MGLLDRERLLAKEALKIERVYLSTDDYVCVKQMTGRERDAFEASLRKVVKRDGRTDYEQDLSDFRAKLAVATICDDDGNLLLGADDIPTLSENMSAYNLEKIVVVAQRLNSISDADRDALVKN